MIFSGGCYKFQGNRSRGYYIWGWILFNTIKQLFLPWHAHLKNVQTHVVSRSHCDGHACMCIRVGVSWILFEGGFCMNSAFTPIYKSGDRSNIANCHPISLLCSTSNILIYNKIIELPQLYLLLVRCQLAYCSVIWKPSLLKGHSPVRGGTEECSWMDSKLWHTQTTPVDIPRPRLCTSP